MVSLVCARAACLFENPVLNNRPEEPMRSEQRHSYLAWHWMCIAHLLVALLPTRLTAAPAQAETPPAPSLQAVRAGEQCAQVVLAGVLDGNWEIVVLDLERGQLLNLTRSPDDERAPAVSPDGTRVAFAARREHNWDVYTMRLADGMLQRLTNDPAYDGQPAWSPDGQRIAFESYRDSNLEIYTMPARGGSATRITDEPAADVEPVWSADGEGLIFGSWRSGARRLYSVDLVTRHAAPLSEAGEEARQPARAPDSRLAYMSTRGDTTRLVVRDVNGAVVNTADAGVQREWPGWQPSSNDPVLVALELTGGGPYQYPTGWKLSFTGTSGAQSWSGGLTLAGQWERPTCLPSAAPLTPSSGEWLCSPPHPPHAERGRCASVGGEVQQKCSSECSIKGSWQPLAQALSPRAEAQTAPRGLATLPNVQALQPRLAAAVSDSFTRLRQHVLDASGHDFLSVLNDAWRDLDHPAPSLLSWHKTGRAMDVRDWYAPGGRRSLFIARQVLAGQTYFRMYLRAARQDGSQGLPLRESLWETDGRLARPELAAAGGQVLPPPSGYYVDFTDLAEREGWTRIPALTPPDGDWRRTYLHLEFWHYERRDGLSWYTAMQQIYDDDELRRRFTTERVLRAGYTPESIKQARLPDTTGWTQPLPSVRRYARAERR